MTEEEEKAVATEEEVKVSAKVGAVRAAAAIMGAVRGRRWGRRRRVSRKAFASFIMPCDAFHEASTLQ